MAFRREPEDLSEQLADLSARLRKVERGDQFGGASSFGQDSRISAGVALVPAGDAFAVTDVVDAVAIDNGGTDLAGIQATGLLGRFVWVQASFNASVNGAPVAGNLSRFRAELFQDAIPFARFPLVTPTTPASLQARPSSHVVSGIVQPTENVHTYQLRLTWVEDSGPENVLLDSTGNEFHQLWVVDVGTQAT